MTMQRIMAVDDSADNLAILDELFSDKFEFRAVMNGEDALRTASQFRPDVILLDLNMPGLNGFETCRLLSAMPLLSNTKIIVQSARADVKDRLISYDLGAVDYICKPFHHEEIQSKVVTWMKMNRQSELNQIWQDLEGAKDGLGRTLTSLVELRDTETGEHLFRMRWYSQVIAEQLAVAGPYQRLIDETFLRRLHRASPLHDIGKIGIDDAILRKPGSLTPEEHDLIKQHTIIGAELLEQTARNLPYADYLPMAIKIARHHHERFNGAGYPDGIGGESIPLSARIVSVADVFDAVTSDRVYRKAMSMDQSIDLIRKEAGKMFDPAIVEAFDARLDEIVQGQVRLNAFDALTSSEKEVFGRCDSMGGPNSTVDHRENDIAAV